MGSNTKYASEPGPSFLPALTSHAGGDAIMTKASAARTRSAPAAAGSRFFIAAAAVTSALSHTPLLFLSSFLLPTPRWAGSGLAAWPVVESPLAFFPLSLSLSRTSFVREDQSCGGALSAAPAPTAAATWSTPQKFLRNDFNCSWSFRLPAAATAEVRTAAVKVGLGDKSCNGMGGRQIVSECEMVVKLRGDEGTANGAGCSFVHYSVALSFFLFYRPCRQIE